jgi:hypothetical protein
MQYFKLLLLLFIFVSQGGYSQRFKPHELWVKEDGNKKYNFGVIYAVDSLNVYFVPFSDKKHLTYNLDMIDTVSIESLYKYKAIFARKFRQGARNFLTTMAVLHTTIAVSTYAAGDKASTDAAFLFSPGYPGASWVYNSVFGSVIMFIPSALIATLSIAANPMYINRRSYAKRNLANQLTPFSIKYQKEKVMNR